jgi:hypothetical protein
VTIPVTVEPSASVIVSEPFANAVTVPAGLVVGVVVGVVVGSVVGSPNLLWWMRAWRTWWEWWRRVLCLASAIAGVSAMKAALVTATSNIFLIELILL